MKTMIKQISLFIITSLFIVSCNNDEVSDISEVSYSNVTVSLNVAENDITINESEIDGEATYVITASIPEAQVLDYVVNFEQLGTATVGEDFTYDRIIIRAGETSASTDVVVYKTGDLEGDETIQLVASSAGTTSNIETFSFNATITDDYTNDNLLMNIEWCSNYEFQFGVGTLTGNYGDQIDLDIFVFDEVTNDLVTYAATGGCPEQLQFGGLPDGSYIAVVFVWDNGLFDMSLGESVPLNVSYEQEYFIDKTEFPHNLNLSTDSAYDTSSMGVPLGPLARIVKSGYEFTVTTP